MSIGRPAFTPKILKVDAGRTVFFPAGVIVKGEGYVVDSDDTKEKLQRIHIQFYFLLAISSVLIFVSGSFWTAIPLWAAITAFHVFRVRQTTNRLEKVTQNVGRPQIQTAMQIP